MTRPSRTVTTTLLLLLILSTSGCAVDRKFFQMDSNSGVPFFGIDLVPRKVSTNAPVDSPTNATPIVARAQDR